MLFQPDAQQVRAARLLHRVRWIRVRFCTFPACSHTTLPQAGHGPWMLAVRRHDALAKALLSSAQQRETTISGRARRSVC
jgi:hypothetical protein